METGEKSALAIGEPLTILLDALVLGPGSWIFSLESYRQENSQENGKNIPKTLPWRPQREWPGPCWISIYLEVNVTYKGFPVPVGVIFEIKMFARVCKTDIHSIIFIFDIWETFL